MHQKKKKKKRERLEFRRKKGSQKDMIEIRALFHMNMIHTCRLCLKVQKRVQNTFERLDPQITT